MLSPWTIACRWLEKLHRLCAERGNNWTARGSGAQLLQPLAIAVIGGVVISMVLSLGYHARTILFTPREGTVR